MTASKESVKVDELLESLQSLAEQPHDVAGAQDEIRQAAALIRELSGRVERMEGALEAVVNPLAYMRRQAEAKGARLNGMAYPISNSLSYVQGIAQDALSQQKDAGQ
jgi:hypothetical protein